MWLVFVGISVICFSGLYLTQRLISEDSQDFRSSALAMNLISAFLATVIFFLNGGVRHINFPAGLDIYVVLLIALVFYGIFERLRFRAAHAVQASEYAVLSNFGIITSFILSVFIYHESLSLLAVFGAVLVLFSLIIASWRPNLKLVGKGPFFVLFAEFLIGVALSLDKYGTRNFGAEFYNILVWVLPLLIIAFPRVSLPALKSEFKINHRLLLVLSCLNVTGFYSMLRAYELADAVRIIPLVQTSSLFAVILGVFLLKEYDRIPQKVISAVLAIIGVFLLVR